MAGSSTRLWKEQLVLCIELCSRDSIYLRDIFHFRTLPVRLPCDFLQRDQHIHELWCLREVGDFSAIFNFGDNNLASLSRRRRTE